MIIKTLTNLKTTVFLTCFFSFFLANVMSAQDFIFSQYYNAPIMLNPAFAGNSDAPHFNINYRNQWPGFDNTFTTYLASYDQYFHNAKTGIGVTLFSDNLGDGTLQNNNVTLTYNYKIEFKDDWQLKIGLSPSLGQTRLDWTKLIFYDQLDPLTGFQQEISSAEIPPENPSNIYFNVHTGVLLYNNRWYAGVSFYNLNSPYQGFWDENLEKVGLPIRYSAHGGYVFILSEENNQQHGTFLTPNLLVTAQANFVQITPGIILQYERLIGGLLYRNVINNSDAVIASAGFMFDYFRVTYSYDLTISSLSVNSGGSHELSIVFNLENFTPRRSKLNDCLRLFN